MSADANKLKERFNALFAQWEKAIQDPKIQLSSRPQDYTNNEPYREIVKLGNEALPFIVEKLEQGIFFLNQAVFDIAKVKTQDVFGAERKFLSEQEKSSLITKWWKSKK
jgi:hypothetical protein